MSFVLKNLQRRSPLADYPWQYEIDRLLHWLKNKDASCRAFCFDLVMSAAYMDAASGIEKFIEQCNNISDDYNAHLGFINLCSPCYTSQSVWQYQKAIKPQSGALGKLSSEVVLRFIQKLYDKFTDVSVVGGVEFVDAVLHHASGAVILAEVKSAPLLTYPFLFALPESSLQGPHRNVVVTSSQLRESEAGLYLHHPEKIIPLGRVGDRLWPFKPLVDFIVDPVHTAFMDECIQFWKQARTVYAEKDRQDKKYYLTNACGQPPALARERDAWPAKESISDGKTSAGMDRTDDIKKGIYQSLKIGTQVKELAEMKTAIVSNLPAYRHGAEYVAPFVGMLWGDESDLQDIAGVLALPREKMRRAFDYLITLEDPVLRELVV
ncbi:MAG: hypothetical protein KUL80_05700 [Comamonas sp.]|nr:hypothetical protein [Comamonas sp.]